MIRCCSLAIVLSIAGFPLHAAPVQLLITTGDVVDGRTISSIRIDRHGLNDLGDVGFSATFPGGEGIFVDSTLLVEEGSTVDGVLLNAVAPPSLSNSGAIAFTAGFGDEQTGLFTLSQKLAADGDTIDGQTITAIREVAFSRSLVHFTFEADFIDGEGMFVDNLLVAEVGDVVDGHEVVDFGEGGPAIDDAGNWVGNPQLPNGTGLIVNGAMVVAPGTSVDGEIVVGVDDPHRNNSENTVYTTAIKSGFATAIAVNDNIVVQAEDIRSPGSGDVIGGLHLDLVDKPLINDRGDVVFFGAIDDRTRWGVFTPDHPLLLDGAIVDGRTVENVISASLNNRGQVAITVEFTDGDSGLLLTTVPEPSALVLSFMAVGALSAIRTRRRRSVWKRKR